MSPGDLVVCVNVGIIRGANNQGLSRLTLGAIYTVEDVSPQYKLQRAGGIRVSEVPLTGNYWWHSFRFRPCRKTNIDGLTAFLKEHEREEARVV
jgi:hypothetical protein